MGCAEGLICGVNNCEKFHTFGGGTGILPATDCCEGKFTQLKVLHASHSIHEQINMSQRLANITQHLLPVADPPAAPTTKAPFVYSSCAEHADCGTNQFCGVNCWTGGCDEGRDDRKGTKREHFCQPCAKCEHNTDSVTHSCEICGVSGNFDDLTHSCLGPVLCRNTWRIFTRKDAFGHR